MYSENNVLYNTILEDCRYYEDLINKGKLYKHYLELTKAEGLNEMFYLNFDQVELWYGTLAEINAIVKGLIKMKKDNGVTL